MRQITIAVFLAASFFTISAFGAEPIEYYSSSYVGDGYPAAFNDYGDVAVNQYFDYMTGEFYGPVLIVNGVVTELADPNWPRIGVSAINNSGVVVGWVKSGGVKNPA